VADRPQLGDTPFGKSKDYKPQSKSKNSAAQAESPMTSVGRLVKDLATGGAYSKTFSARPDGRTDGGSGHDER
jgi:hypothetical protein